MPYGPDYAAWVASQKPKWRAVRQDNKRRKVEAAKAAEAARRAGGAAGAAAAATGPLSMRSLLANQNAAVTAVPWQVLQLAETATPGHLKVRRGSGPEGAPFGARRQAVGLGDGLLQGALCCSAVTVAISRLFCCTAMGGRVCYACDAL